MSSEFSSQTAPSASSSAPTTTLNSHGYEEAPTASSDLVWRAEIVKQLFGDVGEVITDFTCAVESNILLHGRMYVTNRFLCFYSNLFGLEKKIRIPYSHISLITKENTALVIPNAIAITTYRKEYIFRSFWDRDEAFNMLKDLVNKYKGIDTVTSDSDANMDMSVSGPTTRPASESVTSITTETSGVTPKRNSTILQPLEGSQDLQSRPVSIPHQNLSNAQTSNNTPPTPVPMTPVKQNSESKLKAVDDNELDTEYGREELDRQRGATLSSNTSEQQEAFEKDLASSKQKIQIKPVRIAITVTEFCQLFVVDGAKYGYPKYHEDSGDKEIVATSWEDDSTGLGSGREIRFMKPVAVPGLPYARAKKIQRYRRYGNVGLLVCSSTRMEDVPAADTFTVEDCVAVRATGPREVTVEANFDIKWIKSTFFRRVIEGGTIPDVTKWLETFLNTKMVEIASSTSTPDTQSSSTPSTVIPAAPPPEYSKAVVQIPPPPPTSPSISPLALYLIIGILILTLLFVAYELYQMTYNISQLRSQITQLTHQLDKLSSSSHLTQCAGSDRRG